MKCIILIYYGERWCFNLLDEESKYWIHSLESELFDNSKFLYDELMKADNKNLDLIDLRLSEIFTQKTQFKTLLISKNLLDFSFAELMLSWEQLYLQMKLVVSRNDINTSWLCSAFSVYETQHKDINHLLDAIKY
jgi:hypothetical protein